MNRSDFKRIFIGTSILVGLWMLHLSFQYGLAEQKITARKEKTHEIKEVSYHEFETPVTKAYEQAQESVVSVLNYETEESSESSSHGSGVLYKKSDKGIFIVTNHHIIEADSIHHVRFWDGVEVVAKVIGSDVYSDLALLYVEGDYDYRLIDHANSDDLKEGDYVLALGTPYNLLYANSATFGIVSSTNRIISLDTDNDGRIDWDMRVMQSDAAISDGNSGGPLIDMDGKLVGINTLRINKEAVEGMGFAIPINDTHTIIDALEKDGKIRYPSLGITVQSIEELSLTARMQKEIPDSIDEGILIVDVEKGKSADKSGLLKGDIILGIDTLPVQNFKMFRVELFKHRIGDTIIVDVYRNEKVQTIKVVLE